MFYIHTTPATKGVLGKARDPCRDALQCVSTIHRRIFRRVWHSAMCPSFRPKGEISNRKPQNSQFSILHSQFHINYPVAASFRLRSTSSGDTPSKFEGDFPPHRRLKPPANKTPTNH